MNLPLDYFVFLVLAPILVIGEAFTLFRLYELRKVYQARILFLCVILGFVWISSDVFRIIFISSQIQYAFALVSHTAIFLIGPTLVLLTVGIVHDHNKFPSKNYLLLFAPSVIFAGFLYSNPLHGLYFEEIFPDRVGEFTLIGLTYGIVFWLMVALSFSMILWCLYLFFSSIKFRNAKINNRNALLLMTAIFIPFLSEILYLSNGIEGWQKDWAPLFYGVSISILHHAFRPKYHEKFRNEIAK